MHTQQWAEAVCKTQGMRALQNCFELLAIATEHPRGI